MAFDEGLAQRIREELSDDDAVSEKKMFGGIAFMYDGKMFLGVVNEDLMARIGPDGYEDALEKDGVRTMDFTGKPMKGYVFVSPTAIEDDAELQKWITQAKTFVASLD